MESFDKYIGRFFDSRYRIERVIGIGGMAVVFEATDTVLKRRVAIKMLKDDIASDVTAVKRFVSESKAVSMLSHKNIVSIYDVSIKKDLKYIVMEYIDGITLKSYINKRGALSFRETISISEQILRALSHAHAKGIVHRDIKPQNIMLLRDGTIKVADFGIAKLPNAETVTMTDKAIGTVYYISPEQASTGKCDLRSDIYSLGIVIYEMATGTLPFVADSPVTVALMQINNRPARPREINPNIPIGLEQIILEAMEKNPANRFATANDMIKKLEVLKSNPSYNFRPRPKNTENLSRPSSSSPIKRASSNSGNIPRQSGAPQQPRRQNTSDNIHRTGNIPTKNATAPRNEKKNSHSMFPVILGVTLAFFIVIGVSAVNVVNKLLTDQSGKSAITITIDKYISQTYNEELEQKLKDLNYFKVTINDKYSADYAVGEIISQDPLPGEKRKVIPGKQFCAITLTVCRGVKSVVLPDVSIMEYREVEAELKEDYSLSVEIKKEYSDTVKAGYVVSTDPMAGTTVKSGDTIILYVSKGQNVEYVSVPNFIGLSEAEAYALLKSSNLTYAGVTYVMTGTDIYPEKIAHGTVMFQSRTATSSVAVGTDITFVVSLGYEGENEPETETETEAETETEYYETEYTETEYTEEYPVYIIP